MKPLPLLLLVAVLAGGGPAASLVAGAPPTSSLEGRTVAAPTPARLPPVAAFQNFDPGTDARVVFLADDAAKWCESVVHTSTCQGVTAAPPSPVPASPAPSGGIGTALLGGFATWYETPGYTAAAGPALRAALGPHWRGKLIEVQGPGRFSVVVVVSDWCACGSRHGLPTLLDLSRTAFAELADPSVGVVAVSVEIARELPRTDTDVRMMLEVRGDELYR